MKFSNLVFAISVLAVACSSSEQKESQEEETENDKKSFIVAKASDDSGSLTLTGRVTTNPDETVVYKPLSDGIVVNCYFNVGDYVRCGQKLLTVRSTAFYNLQTEVSEAKGTMKLAKRELNKSEQMYNDGLLSEQSLIEAQIEYNNAKTNLGRLQSTLRMYGTTAGRGVYQVNAQTDGFIFSKNAGPSGTISPDDEVYMLSPINNLLILANVYSKSIKDVSVGQKVEITSSAYPDVIFNGEIEKLYPYMESDENVMKAQIKFDNVHLDLKPDFVVDVKIKNGKLNNTICVPSDCLVFDDNKFFVVVSERGKLKRREVTVLSQDKDNAVIGKGINVGDSVLSEKELFYYNQIK